MGGTAPAETCGNDNGQCGSRPHNASIRKKPHWARTSSRERNQVVCEALGKGRKQVFGICRISPAWGHTRSRGCKTVNKRRALRWTAASGAVGHLPLYCFHHPAPLDGRCSGGHSAPILLNNQIRHTSRVSNARENTPSQKLGKVLAPALVAQYGRTALLVRSCHRIELVDGGICRGTSEGFGETVACTAKPAHEVA